MAEREIPRRPVDADGRVFIADPRCFVLEDALATGSREGTALEIEVTRV
jgi:hypothetical protein